MQFVCYSYVTCRYSHVIGMSLVCARILSVCTRMYSYVMVCHSYLLVCNGVSLVCTRMSSVCHSHVLVCHPYFTRMYSYVIRMSLVCGFTMNLFGYTRRKEKNIFSSILHQPNNCSFSFENSVKGVSVTRFFRNEILKMSTFIFLYSF